MKKSLLFAALLLSSAAQAETWICESTAGVGLGLKGEVTKYSALDNFIVDSDQGWKSTNVNKNYTGECVFTPFGDTGKQSLRCYEGHSIGQTTLTIIFDEEKDLFNWISTYSSGVIDAQKGYCTKI